MFRRILFGTDFSPASRPAFRRAVELARQSRGRLLVVHVMPSGWPLGAERYVTPRMYQEMETAVRQSAQKQLDRLVARAVRKDRADLVVVGTHGRTGFQRLLAGSVASRIVGTAPCPVLTVRPR